MILVDTSVWIDHLNKKDNRLVTLLNSSKVCIHPFIIGELSCGNVSNRVEILTLLKALPRLDPALEDEVLFLIDNQRLFGIGLGYIDVHLIAASLIHGIKIWTRDKSLKRAAINLNLHL